MRNSALFFIISFLFICSTNLQAQPEFVQHQIASGFMDAYIVEAGDIDNDGDFDIACCGWQGNRIAWWENDGSLNFSFHSITTFFSYPAGMQLADLDGDNDLDLVAGSQAFDEVYWWEFDNGNYAQHTVGGGVDGCREIYVADIDSDGDLDIAALALWSGVVNWYENDGSQNFTTYTIADNLAQANCIYVVDIDSDGDNDILASAQTYDTVVWYENENNQNWIEHTVAQSNTTGADWVRAGDVDDDGDIDIYGTSHGSDAIRWWENDGNQNYTVHTISSEVDFPMIIRLEDIDSDGDNDFITTEPYDATLSLWLNDGNQNFTEYQVSSTYTGARGLDLIDLDSDGDLDLITTGWSTGRLDWWESDLNPEIVTPSDLIAPANNSVNNELSATFTWTSTFSTNPGTLFEYEFQYSYDESFESFAYINTGVDTVLLIDNWLEENTTLWWRIRAYSPGNEQNVFSNQTWCLNVDSINDPPSEFILLLPVDNSNFEHDEVEAITLAWRSSHDPDFNAEQVTYELIVNLNSEEFNCESTVPDISDTTFILNLVEMFELESWSDSLDVEWQINAVSGNDTTFCQTNFSFSVSPSTVVEGYSAVNLPDRLEIESLYPNPCNSSINVQYSLSRSDNLKVFIYDINGREVKRLIMGQQSFGMHIMSINLDNFSSGTYMVRLSSSTDQVLKKITYLK